LYGMIRYRLCHALKVKPSYQIHSSAVSDEFQLTQEFLIFNIHVHLHLHADEHLHEHTSTCTYIHKHENIHGHENYRFIAEKLDFIKIIAS
jgi:hypothetical protein